MVGGIIKDILKAVTNALLDRKKEQDAGYQKDDAYPEHDKLVLELNEEMRLYKILGVRNPDFQKSVLWAVNNGKQRVRKDKVKYFERHIKTDNGKLSVDESNIKAQNRVTLFMIFCAALMLIFAQICWTRGDIILAGASIGAFFLFVLLTMLSGLTPTKTEITDMKKQLDDYNNRDSSTDSNE